MLKDVLVHLDGTHEDEFRIAHADLVATQFASHLTGLYTNPLPEYAYVLAIQSTFAPMGPVRELEAQVRREGDLTLAHLQDRWRNLGALGEIRRIDAGSSMMPALCVTEARWADLFVASSPFGDEAVPVWGRLVEAVLFGAGHGIYLVPRGCRPRQAIRSILVAWSDTRESARAVAEALPFLAAASEVRVVMVEPEKGGSYGERGSDVAAHLARHGARVEVAAVETQGTVSATLLDQARRMSADLIVMGAYGHSRFGEWLLGGTTRDMMEMSPIPMLVAH